MRAWAWGERSSFRCRRPGMCVSSVYRAWPGDDCLRMPVPARCNRRRFPGRGSSIVLDAADGILDGAVAGAATEIALQCAGRSWRSSSAEGGCRHDHAGRAKAALKALGIDERLLHRMQSAVGGESFNGGHLPARGAEGRHQATVDRLAIEPDGAGPAIAGVAAFLDAEPAQARAGRSAGTGRARVARSNALAVDVKAHDCLLAASSRRISSAK